MNTRGIPLFETGNGREELKRRCREAKIPLNILEGLVEAELEQVGKLKKHGLWERFDEILAPLVASAKGEQEK